MKKTENKGNDSFMDFDLMPEITLGSTLFQVTEYFANLGDPVHKLTEPENYREKIKRGFGVIIVKQGNVTVTREGNCRVETAIHIFKHKVKSICEPTTTVIIVERDGSTTQGGGGSIAGTGGSVTVPNYIYRVVEYQIGTSYRYEFRVKIKVVNKRCPEQAVQTTREILEAKWVLVAVIHHAICERKVITAGIDSPDDAKKIADINAPKGSGIERSNPSAGLSDQ
jgi:hypothetical protein